MSLRATRDRYQLAARRVFGNANQRYSERSGILLTLESDSGYGQGEAAPLPGYSDDDLAETERELAALDYAALAPLIERSVSEPQTLLPALAALSAPRGSAARFAVETALCDLVARRRDEPLHVLLRRCEPALTSAPLAPLPLAALLEPGPLLEQAQRALEEGFKTLKVKLGAPDGEREQAELAHLRERCGDGFVLRLDANRALSASEARRRLSALAPLCVELVEEPCANFAELGDVGIALARDESLRALLNEDAAPPRDARVTTWVVKPSVLAGLSGALRVIGCARALGVDVIVSHTFEGPLGFAALGELALALGATQRAQGLAPYPLLSGWGSAALARRSPWLEPHRRPGLGLERLRGAPRP